MRMLASMWVAAARLRRRLAGRRPPREELLRRFALGRSVADVGCMWGVHGRLAFLAEESGATAVTAVDIMAASPEFLSEHARRSSTVRFVQGDLHEEQVLAKVGPHDVVWCSGLLYHAPSPILTLQRLRVITAELLILATETIPEVPGLAQSCIFFPGLSVSDRQVHAAARPGGGVALGVSTPFDPGQSYGAWWWGLSRSAVRGMLHATGFEITEEFGDALHATFVARPIAVPQSIVPREQ
jgi:hypothetical protein